MIHTGQTTPAAAARYFAAFMLIVLLGAAFRFADLDIKILHGDEANQAVKAAHLYETGDYTYDPHEHHGPTLYYLTLPILWATGATGLVDSAAWQYRFVPAFFGVLSVLLIFGLRDRLGPAGTLWAALLTAISHAMVYYSRYYIQETLFIAFALAALVAASRYAKSPRIGSAIALGAALGLLQATKETAILLYAAAGAALVLTLLWHRAATGAWANVRPYLRPVPVVAIPLTALAVCIVLYTSFFTHPRGILDAVLTYSRYFSRAEGTGSAAVHDQPFLYYLQLLFYTYREPGPRWTEAFALIMAGVGGSVALLGKFAVPNKMLGCHWLLASQCPVNGSEPPQTNTSPDVRYFLRFLALYTLLLLLVFSLVPYKTPWNLLPFWQPLLLLGGIGIAYLTTQFGFPLLRTILCLACALPVAHAAHQTYLGAFTYPADTRNPYVYAHTSTALRRVVERVDQIAAIHPDGKQLVIAVMGEGGDYWPLPWYLRAYPNVGYWPAPPEALPPADIIIASARFGPHLNGLLSPTYHAETGALRPGAILAIFIKTNLWDTFMAPRR